jgi:spore coat protein U-like protein
MSFAFGKTKLALVAFAALAAVSSAQAVTDSTTLNVSLTLTSGCQFSAPSTDVSFGSATSTSAAVALDAIGALNVTCTNGTSYTIGLDGGSNNTGAAITPTASSRRMQLLNAPGNYVAYDLYQDAARTTFWGNIANTDALDGSGTGNPQSIPVYGRVTNVNAVAGAYADVVTATITY